MGPRRQAKVPIAPAPAQRAEQVGRVRVELGTLGIDASDLDDADVLLLWNNHHLRTCAMLASVEGSALARRVRQMLVVLVGPDDDDAQPGEPGPA